MEFKTSSEWFKHDGWFIERVVNDKGETIWFGQDTNYVKKPNSNWTKLTRNYNAKPLEKYVPEIVYGEDRNYFAECEEPIYEKLRTELQLK